MNTAVWVAIWSVGALSLGLAVAALAAWRRERLLPVLRRTDAAFGRGMASFMAGLLFLVAAGVAMGVENGRAQAVHFMEECVQHRPRYECTVLWRAGDRADPAIVPLLIPIPVR